MFFHKSVLPPIIDGVIKHDVHHEDTEVRAVLVDDDAVGKTRHGIMK